MRRPLLLGSGLIACGAGMLAIASAFAQDGKRAEVSAPTTTQVPAALRREIAAQRRSTGFAFPSARDRSAPATVWAVGDGADGTDPARQLARRIAAGRPQRVLYLGDVYETGSREEFTRGITQTYGGLRWIMAPTPGNHEWGKRAEGFAPYWQVITGRPAPTFYAFTIGGWRIISLNSEDPGGAQQAAFLQRELARRADRCAIVMWHRPFVSLGRHRNGSTVAPLWNAVVGRVPVVLNGHDHNLQRFKAVQGTTQYVIGAGGHSRYAVDESDARLAFANDSVDGALRMRLRPGRADLTVVSTAGATLDAFRATCTPAAR